MDETAVCNAISTLLSANLPALRVYPNFQAQINPPCCVIMPGPNVALKLDTFDDASTLTLRLELAVEYAQDSSAVAQLQGFLATSGPNSIYAVIHANPRPAPTVFDSVIATGFQRYGIREWAGQQYFMATIPLEVLAG